MNDAVDQDAVPMSSGDLTPSALLKIEFYKQAHETFRHLDRLRWQVFQMSLAVLPLAFVLGTKADGTVPRSTLLILSAILLTCGLAILKISGSAKNNSEKLTALASEMGDRISEVKNDITSITFWIGWVMVLVAISTMIFVMIDLVNN